MGLSQRPSIRRWVNAVSKLGQRRRRWANIGSTLAQRLAFVRRERSEERGVPWPEVNSCQGRWVALIAHSALYCVTPWTLEIWSFRFRFSVTWSCVSLPQSTTSSDLKFVKLGQIFHYTTFYLHKWKSNHKNTTRADGMDLAGFQDLHKIFRTDIGPISAQLCHSQPKIHDLLLKQTLTKQ